MRMKATSKGAYAIFLAIAEMNGFRKGTEQAKYEFGINCWLSHKLHGLDLAKEKDRKELYENIWLERFYGELDNYYNATKGQKIVAKRYSDISVLEANARTDYEWETPLELDASALTK